MPYILNLSAILENSRNARLHVSHVAQNLFSFWTHFFSLYFIIKIVCVQKIPWNVGPVQPWKWSAWSQPWGLWWTREFTVNVYKQTRSPAMVHLAWLVLLLGKESFWRIYGWSWWPQLQLCKSQAGGEQEGLKTWWAATRPGLASSLLAKTFATWHLLWHLRLNCLETKIDQFSLLYFKPPKL